MNWYHKAAKQGHAEAQNSLGLCFFLGQGVNQDYSEAVKCFREAAENKNAKALYYLGRCHADGLGVGADKVEAVQCYRQAAELDNAEAQFALGQCLEDGIGADKAPAKAVKWYGKAAVQELADAQNALGMCYFTGSGVSQDYSKAVKWFQKAAEQKLAIAQTNLGVCYYEGLGVDKNTAEGVQWFRQAAEQEEPEAQFRLGMFYHPSVGEEPNWEKAVKWYRKAADNGHASAQNNLASCYCNGLGVSQDYTEALKWYRKAAEQKHPIAMFCLGNLYAKGEGVPQDWDEAKEWYIKAAELGFSKAQERLDNLTRFNGNITLNLPGNVELEMIHVKAGEFMMGSPRSESGRNNDEDQHQVALPQDYWLGKFEVTQAQWQAVMDKNFSQFKNGGDCPVECVNWEKAREFCEKLNSDSSISRPAGYRFDLPTEAQWEFACRGGIQSRNFQYSGSNTLGDVAWYRDNGDKKTHPVGKKDSNELGFHDMSGNVGEWCRDLFSSHPSNNATDLNVVFRGGSWNSSANSCRSARRELTSKSFSMGDIGFRIALVPEP